MSNEILRVLEEVIQSQPLEWFDLQEINGETYVQPQPGCFISLNLQNQGFVSYLVINPTMLYCYDTGLICEREGITIYSSTRQLTTVVLGWVKKLEIPTLPAAWLDDPPSRDSAP